MNEILTAAEYADLVREMEGIWEDFDHLAMLILYDDDEPLRFDQIVEYIDENNRRLLAQIHHLRDRVIPHITTSPKEVE